MLAAIAYGNYWERYGERFESMCNSLEETPDRVLILTDKPIVTKYENVVYIPQRGLNDYSIGDYRQRALDLCDCDWLIQIDIDDIMYPNYISDLNDDVDWHIFLKKNNEMAIKQLEKSIDNFYNTDYLPYGNLLNSAIKTQVLRQIGGFKTSYGWEDIVLACDLFHNNAKYFIDPTLRGERLLHNEGSLTKDPAAIRQRKSDETKKYHDQLKRKKEIKLAMQDEKYFMIKYENKIYSQNGEDGIIEHIFDTIGTTNKIAIEIGVSTGPTNIETNTANLIANGWNAYWFDCLVNNEVPNNCIFTKKMLTADNVVETFERLDIPKDIDLLSIDIDGNDYHLREALSQYRPRVCIMEYNGCFSGEIEYIMPRNDSYYWPGETDRNFGVSLKSCVIQADRLGYDLVYCESNGVNAFFVRKDVNVFKPTTSEEAWVKLHWSCTPEEKRIVRTKLIKKLYLSILGREADTNGLNHYVNSELDMIKIQQVFRESDEYKTANRTFI